MADSLEQDPLLVYMMACRYRLKDEAMVAAAKSTWPTLGTLDMFQDYGPEWEHVTGAQLYHLFHYNQSCEAAAQRVIEEMSSQFPCCRVCGCDWAHVFPEVGFGEAEFLTAKYFNSLKLIAGVTEGLWRERTNIDLIGKVYQDTVIAILTELLWRDEFSANLPMCLKCRPLFPERLQVYRDTLMRKMDEALSKVRDFW